MQEPITMPLDIRNADPAGAGQMVLNKLKGLAAGRSFQLLSDRDPKHLQQQLQASFGTGFTWDCRESGPLTWRVQIGKTAVEASHCCSGGACGG